MSRKQIYAEIEETLGLVPTFFKSIPDAALELEWNWMKQVQMAEGPIPNKYRELIGLGIAASSKCRYCAFFHTEMAKLNGATDAEIADAVQFAMSTSAWSTWVNGLQMDYDQFKSEIRQAAQHVRAAQAAKERKPTRLPVAH